MTLTLSIIALILSLVGNILVNYKKKLGFIIWISSNVFWIALEGTVYFSSKEIAQKCADWLNSRITK